jgi:hypothetical protein
MNERRKLEKERQARLEAVQLDLDLRSAQKMALEANEHICPVDED